MARLSRLLRRGTSPVRDKIRTQRLLLRPLDEADLAEVARLAGDWEVASMTARIPYPYTLDDARHWLDGLEPGEVVRAITDGGDGRLLGITGYLPSEDGTSAEIGYWIGKPYWGKGYATEAAAALVEFCFKHADYARLTCCHFADNPASARVIEKLGFSMKGTCSCWCEARRREADATHYELHRPSGRLRLPRVG